MIVAELDGREEVAQADGGSVLKAQPREFIDWFDPRNQTIKEKQPVDIDAINWEEIWELVFVFCCFFF